MNNTLILLGHVATGKVFWKCLVGGASKWKRGQVLEKKITTEKELILHASYIEKRTIILLLSFPGLLDNMSFAELLHHAGAIPLPPYIKREAEATMQKDTKPFMLIMTDL